MKRADALEGSGFKILEDKILFKLFKYYKHWLVKNLGVQLPSENP